MVHVVVMGAGLSGTIMAYELLPLLRQEDDLTVIGQRPRDHFVPSNPWVAIGWRERADIEIDLDDVMRRKGIRYLPQGVRRMHAEENRIDLEANSAVRYDYLVIAAGPDLAFDEVPGLGPNGHTQSICHVDHAAKAREAFERFVQSPGPVVVGAVQGGSCFGPACEFAFILDTELRKRRIRDRVPMTFVTAEPYVGHLGLDGVGDTKGLLESEMRERHDRTHGHRGCAKHRRTAARSASHTRGHLECGLPRRFRRQRRRLRGAAADSAAQRQLAHPRASGFTTPRSRSRNISCARSGVAKVSLSTNGSCSNA